MLCCSARTPVAQLARASEQNLEDPIQILAGFQSQELKHGVGELVQGKWKLLLH